MSFLDRSASLLPDDAAEEAVAKFVPPEPLVTLSPDEFASQLQQLRPGLVEWTARRKPCSIDDAEDLVSDATRIALLILPQFDATTGPDGLRRWMTGVVRCVILTHAQKEKRRPKTGPIADESASQPETAPPKSDPERIWEEIASLAEPARSMVFDWYAGYSQIDLSRRYRIHRNTVANRLQSAFQALRKELPDAGSLAYTSSLFAYFSQVTIYRKPTSASRYWTNNHPPEKRLPLRTQRPPEACTDVVILRRSLLTGYTICQLAKSA